MTPVNSRRKYRSPLREEAALRGQQAVIAAAADLFVEQGYGRTTIDQIAERARVSRPTVFAVGSKAHLLALARRAAIGGESAMGNEPEFAQILATPDATELLHRFAGLTSGIARRWAPLQAVLAEAAASDPSLTELQQASRDDMYGCARRVVAALRSLGSLRAGLEPKAAADVLWLLIDPSQYRRLVTERHWSHRAFQRWQADAMTRLLLA
jgi:AcrR family transcriptional regulator